MTEKLEKISVRLFHGDFRRLQTKYPKSGASLALRELLRAHLNHLDEEPKDLIINLPSENHDEPR